MLLDEPEDRERYVPRHEERLRGPPVTASYLPDPGYTSYSYPVTSQPSAPGISGNPRFVPGVPGNTTPPSGRTPSGYESSIGYPPTTTRPSMPSIAAPGYTDPRGTVRDSGYTYPPEPRSRHR